MYGVRDRYGPGGWGWQCAKCTWVQLGMPKNDGEVLSDDCPNSSVVRGTVEGDKVTGVLRRANGTVASLQEVVVESPRSIRARAISTTTGLRVLAALTASSTASTTASLLLSLLLAIGNSRAAVAGRLAKRAGPGERGCGALHIGRRLTTTPTSALAAAARAGRLAERLLGVVGALAGRRTCRHVGVRAAASNAHLAHPARRL